MPLVHIREPFDHPDWIYELKLDGFRALARIDGHRCELISRNGHRFNQWDLLCEELAHAVQCDSAILDGEIVCLDDDGRPNFHKLLFRRDWPFFYAFDVLALDGVDVRLLPLIHRKRLLKRILPTVESRVRYVDHIAERGSDFYSIACNQDLEGIVAKWKRGTYQSAGATSWLKIKNPDYSQAVGRHELFEKRRPKADRTRWTKPELLLA
jgi:bifunctional non-homologous end joining protein LigD